MQSEALKSRSRLSEHNTDIDLSFPVVYGDLLFYLDELPGFKINRRLNIVPISYPTRAGPWVAIVCAF